MKPKALKIVTAALLLSNAMTGLDSTIIGTALPSIVSDLHGIQFIGWVVASFLLGTAVTAALWSKLGERIGNKRAFQISTLLFSIGSLLQGLSPTMFLLILSRLVMGIGCGGMLVIPYIVYADLYKDPYKRAKVFGLVTASASIAAVMGPLIGGFIVTYFSWHWVFYINVPIGLISIVIVEIFYVSNAKKSVNKPIDYLGALFLSGALVSLLVAIEILNSSSLLIKMMLFIVTLIMLSLFVLIERKAVDPIIPERLFHNRQLVCEFIMFTFIYGFFIGGNIYIPMWAQGVLGLSAIIGGASQVPSAITNFIGTQGGNRLQQSISSQLVVSIGICSMILSSLFLVILPHAGYGVLLMSSALQGLGIGICFVTLQVSVQQKAEPQDVPIATSFSLLCRMIGQTLMASIYSLIMNRDLFSGVARSGGKITLHMMNELTDPLTARLLNPSLLPTMRQILHNGLQHIMLFSVVLLLISLIINLFDTDRSKS
ncbi:MAG: MFS transporter [Sporolactobacillus sp.]